MNILLLTPPMTQLNTPYPATAYLTGFLKQQGYKVNQRDLAIEVLLDILTRSGLEQLYDQIVLNYQQVNDDDLPDSIYHFLENFDAYYCCVEAVVRFLQGHDSSLALRIVSRKFLPEGPQFEALHQMEQQQEEVLSKAFGALGVQDKAKYLATLFINDIAVVIKDGVDGYFELSRYAESLASSNPYFDDLERVLKGTLTYTEKLMGHYMASYIAELQPDVIAITVPFPGNMLAALQIGKYCRQFAPEIKVVLGGGFINTELRSLTEPRIFQYVDYICLDDGERPLLSLLECLEGKTDKLFKTYSLVAGKVVFHRDEDVHNIAQKFLPPPSYQGLPLNRYLSLCEMLNPMHRIWSDGRWNKLTLAHGCYWAKCSFCDISLDYIGQYDDAGVEVTLNRIKTLIAETGQTGFHFVDEAAPPKALFSLAKALIEQEIVITWWGNIRFEKNFSAEKCQLLADSGCIAVSGGLEVASDRLLALMNKGVSVAQVARITKDFSEAGILVHAYLMYGFPGQTEQETVDALEYVRQLMLHECIHSAYWHRFAATIHSPVGLNPDKFAIKLIANQQGGFAENEINYIDSVSTDHDMLGKGLKKALYNYMHKTGFDYSITFWFEQPVNNTLVLGDYIEKCLTIK